MRPETLHPFEVLDCAMCGANHATAQYCERSHSRTSGSSEAFEVDEETHGSACVPHLHRSCDACGFEWLTRTKGNP